MTDEELAELIEVLSTPSCLVTRTTALRLARELVEARAAEREACAQIAGARAAEYHEWRMWDRELAAAQIAAQIRARGQG